LIPHGICHIDYLLGACGFFWGWAFFVFFEIFFETVKKVDMWGGFG